jgi:hypothetical protein
MKKILKETIRLLENEIAVVWATVVEHKGSTPRKVASRMLIRSNGEKGQAWPIPIAQKGRKTFPGYLITPAVFLQRLPYSYLGGTPSLLLPQGVSLF